jgi:hypothetical protein
MKMGSTVNPAMEPPVPGPAPLARFQPRAPQVHFERILRIQGYTEHHRVRPAIARAAQAMADLAPRLGAPDVAYLRVPIRSIDADRLELEGGAAFHCAAFPRQLGECTEVAAFVLTAGKPLDERVIALAEAGDLLEALLLETTGWLCIEDATRQFKSRLRDEALERGQRITSRMGPGYSYRVGGATCTWDLEEQAQLFGLFGEAALPVTLMQGGAMSPKMSRSGLFGLAPLRGGGAP